MNRKQKFFRLLAAVSVLSALAIPCAGWGWDGAADSGSDTPAAAATP
jgi:hypothetical protein